MFFDFLFPHSRLSVYKFIERIVRNSRLHSRVANTIEWESAGCEGHCEPSASRDDPDPFIPRGMLNQFWRER